MAPRYIDQNDPKQSGEKITIHMAPCYIDQKEQTINSLHQRMKDGNPALLPSP